jgi:3-phenylpropionate/trans-cinnamate dioxygenase ferredoxin subunit
MPWQRIDLPAPLEPGGKAPVIIGEREILICRIGDEYHAVSNRCTHSAWPLAGEPVEGIEIVCTLHGARFDLRDGCPTAGPASRPLDTFPIELRDDGLYLRI